MLKRINRLFLLLRLRFLLPEKRSLLTKKMNLFSSQGKDCYFCVFNFGSEPHLLSFGDNVMVATGVRFITHDMSYSMVAKKNNLKNKPPMYGKIFIDNNVFIGADSVILPNINIGSNVIIAAGSVVTKDIESNCIVGGNPAKVIKDFSSFEEGVLSYYGENVEV